MTSQEFLTELAVLSAKLDNLQETELAQENEDLMWELGEAMGAIENAISVLEDED